VALIDFDLTLQDVEKIFLTNKKVNIAYETIDKNVEKQKKDAIALIYTDGSFQEKYTFLQLKEQSNIAGNFLLNLGVKAKDRVFIFMPRSPELLFFFLGVIKIGAIVGTLFEGFMKTALQDRLNDSKASVIITTPLLVERLPLASLPYLKKIVLVGEKKDIGCKYTKDVFYYEDEKKGVSKELDVVFVDKEEPMLIHYTSGSTGKPKGVVHVHNAMVQHYYTAKTVLGLNDDDVYFCTADPGWVTGTSYGIFAPWLCGVCNVVFSGRFNPSLWYKTLESCSVTVWYTAPTALRLLMAAGDALVKKYDFSSLKNIFSVGEPLNPEVIFWGERVFQKVIRDTWWMTETGAILIANYKGLKIKPGSMGKPLPFVTAAILDDDFKEVGCNVKGNLAIKAPWPSMMRGIWQDPKKYSSYFKNGWYISSDVAYKDEDGYFWFCGRKDDLISSAGKRIGPFEIESKLLEHRAVVEAGVIGIPDSLLGEKVKAFVVLKEGFLPSDELKEELKSFVKKDLSAHFSLHEVSFVAKLPKTRSGKIMRRVLKAKELNLPLGDLSTLED